MRPVGTHGTWGLARALDAQASALGCSPPCFCSKTLQRNRKMAMGRKKFNMDPKKVSGEDDSGMVFISLVLEVLRQ